MPQNYKFKINDASFIDASINNYHYSILQQSN